jgi:cyclopropane fatty-acyl-phospholipid synthase-like methyltransferase
MNETTSEMQKLKDKIRDTWTAGDFGEIAKAQAAAAAEFVERLGLKPGMKILDVACGSCLELVTGSGNTRTCAIYDRTAPARGKGS